MNADCGLRIADCEGGPPPTHGTTFLAEATVIGEEGSTCGVDPVIGRMRFSESGELVWALGGLSVRGSLDAVVRIDRWTHTPQPGCTFAWLTDPRFQTSYDDGGAW